MARNVSSKSLQENDVFSRLPQNLVTKLMPFQREGILFAVRKNGRCLIADEMGLGKTIQAISIACFYKEEWPLLIIVPSSLRYSWIEELEKWLPDIHPQDINLIQGGNDASGISLAKVTITTFGLLSKKTSHVVLEALANQKFKVIIVDESHYIRNSKTASCKAVAPLITNADRRILLSGTPALSKPVELYPQIDALCPGKFGSWWQFTERYCDAKVEWIGRIRKRSVDGASNLEELQSRLASTLMIRREKSEVLKQLPPKQRQKVLFELKDSNIKKDIRKLFEEVLTVLRKSNSNIAKLLRADNSCSVDEGQKENIHVLSLIQQLYRLSGEAKIGPVREYVEMLCDNCSLKFLVFAFHHSMMNGVQLSLWEKKVKFIRIDGETKPSERPRLVQQFQSDPDTRVAILSILAAGVGLTLTAAKLVVFAEMYWTPGVLVQCEDRAHRIGQTSAVPVHYLVAKDTMDEWVWSAVCRKTIVTTATLNGKKQALQAYAGDQYQIDVLSKADAWVPNQNQNLDLSGFFQSQQPQDQRSILDFFSSQSTPNSSPKSSAGSNVKNSCVNFPNLSSSSALVAHSVSSPQLIKKFIPIENDEKCEYIPLINSTVEKENKQKSGSRKKKKRTKSDSFSSDQASKKLKSTYGVTSVIVIDSDDEKDFQMDFATAKRNKKLLRASVKKNHKPKSSNETSTPKCDKTKRNLLSESDEGNVDRPYGEKTDNSVLETDAVVTEENDDGETDAVVTEENDDGETDAVVTEDNDDGETDAVVTEENDDGELSKHWGCVQCTFLNNSVLPYCELCETPRKVSIASKSRLSTRSVVDVTSHSSNQNTSNIKTTTKSQSILLKLSSTSTEKESNYKCKFGYEINLDKSLAKTDKKCNLLTKKEVDTADIDDRGIDKFVDINSDTECNFPTNDGPFVMIKEFKNSESLFSDDSNQDVSGSPSSFKKSDDDFSPNSSFEISESIESSPATLKENIEMEGVERQSNYLGGDVTEKSAIDSNIEDETFDDWDSDVEHDDIKDAPADKEERLVNLDEITVYSSFIFCCSKYTGRIYLFDKEGKSLDVNFLPLDVEIGNQDGLPDLLFHPSNLRLTQRFVREWHSLTETKRRLITKQEQLFASPLVAYEEVRSGNTSSKQRYRTKIDTAAASIAKAKEVNGSVRLVSRPQPAAQGQAQTVVNTPVDGIDDCRKGVVQAVDKDGTPLCLHCFKPYTNNLLHKQTITGQKNAWQTRFCSSSCMDTYWMKTNTEYCREKLFELEHGVCQICHFDAYNFYRQVRDCVDLKKRAEIIAKSKFSKFKSRQKEQMTKHPVAGQFWHADHIKPVWEGGGQCDIDNLRTLCVVCHLKITAGQARKRAIVRRLSAGAGASDITAFFPPS